MPYLLFHSYLLLFLVVKAINLSLKAKTMDIWYDFRV